MDDKQDIGRRIRLIRMSLGMTQTSFASKIGGLATSTVSAYESGTLVPPPETIKMIAELVSLTSEDVYGGNLNFDKVVREFRHTNDNRRRIRERVYASNAPSAHEIRFVIDRIERLQAYLSDATDKLCRQESILLEQANTDAEKRLLVAFRALPVNRKKRFLEDVEEWAKAFESKDDVKTAT